MVKLEANDAFDTTFVDFIGYALARLRNCLLHHVTIDALNHTSYLARREMLPSEIGIGCHVVSPYESHVGLNGM